MQNNSLSLKVSVDSIMIILLSITYAGISSNVLFGFRVVDILLLTFFIYKIGSKFKISFLIVLLFWLSTVLISTYIGIKEETKYLLSDIRFFSVLGIAAFLGYSLGNETKIDFEKVYYRLLIITAALYILIFLFPFLREYYVPASFLAEEHANTIYGPSVVVINFLYVYLVLIKKNRTLLFYSTYLLFAVFIYSLRISRQDLVIMLLFFAWSLLYSIHTKIKLKHILGAGILGATFLIFLYFNQNERIQGIFNPTQDTSFVYRILSNDAFLVKFNNAPLENKLFGLGMGSSLPFFFNEWFGVRWFVLLDNTPLTLLMKVGIYGLITYLFLLFYPIRSLSFHKKIVLLFPVLFSMFLFSHAIYNLLYIFGLYLVSINLNRVKEEKG